jgi:hypothetical protein
MRRPVRSSWLTRRPRFPRTLMTAPDGRRWVVVRTGEVVDELHELADDGTVTLSQYRIPRKDDAK